MSKIRHKRPHPHDYTRPSSSEQYPNKIHDNHGSAPSLHSLSHHHRQQQPEKLGKRPTFVSYLETPNLPTKVKILCEIIANTPSPSVDKVLEETGIRVSSEDVEDVLKLSYTCPAAAVKFFRWAGYQLKDNHSPYTWNLVVDLLGKNSLFDAMWDAIKSMKKEGLISLATFASVFSSYVSADKVDEAFMTFEVMDQYGIPRDLVALNSLISAICRDGKTGKADIFLRIAKDKIRPDADTYAILLEGWENEGNIVSARQTFGDMVADVGWDPVNVPAYDSFLCTLLRGPNGMHEAMKFFNTMKEKRCTPGLKFFGLALEECARKCDARGASQLWEAMMVRNLFRPDARMYNLMISLHCRLGNPDTAIRFLDEMIYAGLFPDSETYNVLLQSALKNKKLREASSIFTEMIKNEFVPSHTNCVLGVRTFLGLGDSHMAIKIWRYMVENHSSDLEETGNFLINELGEIKRIPETVKYAEDMIDRGIKLSSSTLSKLRQTLSKAGKMPVYDELLKKWKTAPREA